MFLVVHAAVYHLLLVEFEILMNFTSDDWQQLASDLYVWKLLNGDQEEASKLQGFKNTKPC